MHCTTTCSIPLNKWAEEMHRTRRKRLTVHFFCPKSRRLVTCQNRVSRDWQTGLWLAGWFSRDLHAALWLAPSSSCSPSWTVHTDWCSFHMGTISTVRPSAGYSGLPGWKGARTHSYPSTGPRKSYQKRKYQKLYAGRYSCIPNS